MRVPLETKLAPTKPPPDKQNCYGGNDHQRHHLLPIHARNISLNLPGATNDCTPGTTFLAVSLANNCKGADLFQSEATGSRLFGPQGCASRRTVVRLADARRVEADRGH